MAVRKPHTNQQGIYFITFTCYKWLPLFNITESWRIVYKWFDHLKGCGHQIVGYVIMPNHVHALINFTSADKSINTIISNGKRFMAYELIATLKEQKKYSILTTLANAASTKGMDKGQKHRVFETSFDMKLCSDYKFIQQKLNYIHANPLSKKWNLADDPVNYEHSSARFYEFGEHGLYEVTDYLSLLDKDLYHSSSAAP